MPERKTGTARVDATRVQGEGAWVDVRKMLWGEHKQMAAWPNMTDEEEAGRLIEEFLGPKLVAWNWVDQAGEPLPAPTEPGILDRLTREEVAFLISAVR